MRARLDRLLRRLGMSGVLGIAVLVGCAGFWLSGMKPLEEKIATQRLALERVRARPPYQPVATNARAEELRRFQNAFPPTGELTNEVEGLHRLARRAGLELAQGEYRLERRPTGLWAYRVTLPVRGSYPQIRSFLASVLKDMPLAAIDALRFERKKLADTELEAQVRLTLYVRLAGDAG